MAPFRVTERARKAVWDSLGYYDLRERIQRTFPNGTAPRSLLLHGVYDPMPLEAARETAALLSTGGIELATGHAPHVEATGQFDRALDGFLPHACAQLLLAAPFHEFTHAFGRDSAPT